MSNTLSVELDQLEDRLDSAHAMLAHIEALHEEAFPFTLVERLMDGENAVRVYREYRDMTVGELAAAASLAPDQLADIEAGAAEPGLRTSARLAEALRIDVDSLVPWADRQARDVVPQQ